MDHLWLPVHDEIIVCVPEQDTREVARVMEAVMASDFMGVPITANATILGERWHKYPRTLAGFPGSTRFSARSTRSTVDSLTCTTSSREPRWASLRVPTRPVPRSPDLVGVGVGEISAESGHR